jgi:hypothetical protein
MRVLTEGAGNGCECDAAAGHLGCSEELERHRCLLYLVLVLSV